MPALGGNELTAAIAEAIAESSYVGALISSARRNPRRFVISGVEGPHPLAVYAWTLTFGGRPSLRREYRIQMTGVSSPLALEADGHTVLVGYEPTLKLFAGFDLQRHQAFTTGSPSVQIDIDELRRAETDGLSFQRKSNNEIAIGIRPDMFMAYAMNASALHHHGRRAEVLGFLREAVQDRVRREQVDQLPRERQRVVQEVNRLSREAGFRRRVLFAYGNKCAVTRVQLRLVEAAHILPVGVPDSIDRVQNGIALSPTYHRAFDAGLIFLNEQFEMVLNRARVHELESLNLVGGLEGFRAPLGAIFLPPDSAQRPALDLIRKANRVRQISA